MNTTARIEPIRFVVTQEMLNEFGRVSGSNGGIHTDPDVAHPLFGGTIVQGMFLLDSVVQLMVRLSSLNRWYARGAVDAKFVGNTLVGETVAIAGSVDDTWTDASGSMARCHFSATTGDDHRTVLVAEATGPLDLATWQENE